MHISKKGSSLPLALALGGVLPAQALVHTRGNGNAFADTATACQTLYNAYPELTLFSNTTEYITQNEEYFSAASWLGPACIFTPTSTEIAAFGIKTLSAAKVKFAIQGGGHMPIAGAANIDSSGILLSSAGLDQLIMSEDRSSVSIGPGNRWAAVYKYLEPWGKAVVGGRMGVVGVPGYLLGGGISFFGNEYGWSSANMASFECVLADGSVVNATADNEHSDLFWSLRGGGNNFAFVTNFEMKTIDAPGVYVGQIAYTGSDLRDPFLQAVHDFAHDGMLDQKAGVTPMINWSPAQYGPNNLAYSAMAFYGANNTNPAALGNFTGSASTSLPVKTSSMSYRSMSKWSDESVIGFNRTHGLFFRFGVTPILADLDAMGAVVDALFNTSIPLLSNITGVGVTAAVMPISESFLTNNRGDVMGDPMGVDTSKAPFVWIEQTWVYALAKDTSYVDSVIRTVNRAIDEALTDDVKTPYLYLNDADSWQSPFETYGSANLGLLKSYMKKYDPEGVFTTQVPGGFKIADASTGV